MQSFLAQLRSLPPAGPKTIRFFDRKDFLSVYGADAEFVADKFNKTRSTIKYLSEGEHALASQNVTARLLPEMLRRLVREENYAFEIWAVGPKSGNWELASKGSPGNFDEGEFGEQDDERAQGPGIMAALHVGKEGGATIVGVAYVDVLRSVIGVAQFADVESLANAETALMQLGASECVIPKDNGRGSSPFLKSMLARADVAASERPSKDFVGGTQLFSEVQRLLDATYHTVKVEMMPEMLLEQGVAALAGLLRSLELLADLSSHGKFRLCTFAALEHCMRLDSAAMTALGLLPSAQDAHKGNSLFGRFATRTPMGGRKLASWIRQPLLDVSLINARLDAVEGLVHDATLRASLQQEMLKGVPDVQRLLHKFQRAGKAGLQDVVKLYQAVQVLPKLVEGVSACSSEKLRDRFQLPLVQLVADFGNFCNMVESTLDLEALAQENAFRLRPSFDERLKVLHTALAAQMKLLKAEQQRAANWSKKVELEEKKGQGWVLRVAKTQEKGVLDAAKKDGVELVEVASSKSGFLFRTPKMEKAAKEHTSLQKEYGEVQSELVVQLLAVVQGYAPAMEQLSELLSDLDVFAAMATTATSAALPYVRPVVSENGNTVLRGCRHPCLEADGTFIPNDVRLERGKREVCIITGPNMGGKSTYIRSAAISVLMAQIGCFVPCLSAEISISDAILCRVGAADSQARGVSTFMAEMLEMAQILRLATPKSLLVIDELGRGTSTYDGFGLACAIAEHLASNTKAFCFFATHFHELTDLSRSLPNVVNLHVTARTDANALTLLYEVREGPCDQSFGIHVAELARFPPRVLAAARRKAAQLERFDAAPVAAAESPAKRSRPDDEEGSRLLDSFLEETRKLQETAGPAATVRTRELLSRLLASNNAYVHDLVQKAKQLN